MSNVIKSTMVDCDGEEIKVGDVVVIIKAGRYSFDWTPKGYNSGVVVELDSATLYRKDGHITVEFANGERYCYLPNYTRIVRQ